MKIVGAEFQVSAVSAKQYPRDVLPEFAFAGRSNVGKSSLINSLLNRKKLVKTSATPGKTQTLNFFRVNDRLFFVDLPGYGFARVPSEIKKRWGDMIEQYFLERETLVSVVLILDIRREPTDVDLNVKKWLESCGIDHTLVATKSDKLSRAERDRQLRVLGDAFLGGKQGEIIPYSSKTGEGRKELWRALLKKAGERGVAVDEPAAL